MQDRASQIAAIENSFEQAKQPVSCTNEAGCLLEGGRGRGRGGKRGGGGGKGRGGRGGCVRNVSLLPPQITKHYSKPGVVAEEVLPVFPDFEVCRLTECRDVSL